jgi:hypothetical protein
VAAVPIKAAETIIIQVQVAALVPEVEALPNSCMPGAGEYTDFVLTGQRSEHNI